ncbi:MAG TPA: helix-turn-helix domain-containing protein [Euzebya sp.]|nr:helix-turn-helix domain-containing protein [Euzebya sp.]
MTVSDYRRGALHPRLRPYITAAQGYHLGGFAPGIHVGMPSPALTLIVSLGADLDVTAPGAGGARGSFSTLASGLAATPALIHHDGTQAGIQLALTPAGARVLLGLPAAALAEEVVGLHAIWGRRAAELADRVGSAGTWEGRFAALSTFLLQVLGDRIALLPPEVDAAWNLLVGSCGQVKVADVAREVGWSRRHLASRFHDELGVSPKAISSVARFDRARHLVLARPDLTLAHVAAECGYADQAHFNREWRRMAGTSPTAWRLAESLPFVQDVDDAAPQDQHHGQH